MSKKLISVSSDPIEMSDIVFSFYKYEDEDGKHVEITGKYLDLKSVLPYGYDCEPEYTDEFVEKMKADVLFQLQDKLQELLSEIESYVDDRVEYYSGFD